MTATSEEIERAKETGEIGNLDPMTDSPLLNPSEPTPDEGSSEPEPAKEVTPEDIAKRLEGGEQAVAEQGGEDKIIGEEPLPIDLKQFSPEVLQALKRMLNSTPDRPQNKKDGITIKLREYEDSVITGFGRAFNGYVVDPEEPTRKIATPKIKVSVFGHEEPVELKYEDFMSLPRKEFKVLDTRTKTDEVEEGETISNETGKLVTMIATYQTRFFMVDINGTKVELEEKVANA